VKYNKLRSHVRASGGDFSSFQLIPSCSCLQLVNII